MAPAGDLSAAPGGAEIVVEGVSRRFGERVRALEDVSFVVPAGELALLTGPSGAGKSTLLNVIAGFDQPDRGRVVIGGADLARLPDAARFRRDVLGFVFQLHHLIGGLTAEENVEIPLIPTVRRRGERLARAHEALAAVGLAERRTHLPSELSGGERQRVAIARALVGRPTVLLADEPTGSLDSAASEEVLDLLARLVRETGITVLLVSHEHDAQHWAGHVLELLDGRLVRDERLDAATRGREPAAGA